MVMKSISGFDTLITGVTIHVKFTYGNTAASPTLKVGSTGAKAIKMYGTTAVGNTKYTSWYDGAVVSFTYDGTNWVMNDFTNLQSFPFDEYNYFAAAGSGALLAAAPDLTNTKIVKTHAHVGDGRLSTSTLLLSGGDYYTSNGNNGDYYPIALHGLKDGTAKLCDDNAKKYNYVYAKYKISSYNVNGSAPIIFNLNVMIGTTTLGVYKALMKLTGSTTSAKIDIAKLIKIGFTDSSRYNNLKFIFDVSYSTYIYFYIGLDMTSLASGNELYPLKIICDNFIQPYSAHIGSCSFVDYYSTNTNPYSSNKKVVTPA